MIFKLNKPPIYYDADADAGGGGDKGGDGGNAGGTGDKALRSFTQAELDAMFTDRARRASESAVNDLLGKAGFKTADELLTVLTDAKKLKDSQKTELEKVQSDLQAAQDKLVTAEAEKKTALEQATERLMKAQVLSEAAVQGFRPEAINDVWLIVDRAKIKEKDGEFEGVKEAVAEVVKLKPFWMVDKTKPQGTPKPGDKKTGSGNETAPEPVRVRF